MELLNNYTGRNLRIRGHIYGQPDVEYILLEDKYYGPRQIARSFDLKKIEALKSELEAK